MVRIERIRSEYPRIFFSNLHLGPENTPTMLSNLKISDFYVWDSQKMVQVPSSIGAGHSVTHVDVHASDVDFSVTGLPAVLSSKKFVNGQRSI